VVGFFLISGHLKVQRKIFFNFCPSVFGSNKPCCWVSIIRTRIFPCVLNKLWETLFTHYFLHQQTILFLIPADNLINNRTKLNPYKLYRSIYIGIRPYVSQPGHSTLHTVGFPRSSQQQLKTGLRSTQNHIQSRKGTRRDVDTIRIEPSWTCVVYLCICMDRPAGLSHVVYCKKGRRKAAKNAREDMSCQLFFEIGPLQNSSQLSPHLSSRATWWIGIIF
jgi:hypothetical protein